MCSVQMYTLSVYEIYNYRLHILKDEPEDGHVITCRLKHVSEL